MHAGHLRQPKLPLRAIVAQGYVTLIREPVTPQVFTWRRMYSREYSRLRQSGPERSVRRGSEFRDDYPGGLIPYHGSDMLTQTHLSVQ